MFFCINKENWKVENICNLYLEKDWCLTLWNFSEEDEKTLQNWWVYNFETQKVEETEESQARMLEIEKQADIENAKNFYIENRNLKMKHIMAWELSDWTPEAEAEIERIKAEIVKDYEERQEVMKQKVIDFKNKYGEDLYSYIIFDKNI